MPFWCNSNGSDGTNSPFSVLKQWRRRNFATKKNATLHLSNSGCSYQPQLYLVWMFCNFMRVYEEKVVGEETDKTAIKMSSHFLNCHPVIPHCLISAGQRCWRLLPYMGNLPGLPAAVCPHSQQKPAHPHWYQGCGSAPHSHSRYSALSLTFTHINC